RLDRSTIAFTQEPRAVRGRDFDRLFRNETSLDQQFDFALISKAGDHTSPARRVGARQEPAAGSDECPFELDFLGECRSNQPIRVPVTIPPGVCGALVDERSRDVSIGATLASNASSSPV